MSEYKRRDLLSYFNNNHIETQKKELGQVNIDNNIYVEFLEFNNKSGILNKNHIELDKEINRLAVKAFGCLENQFIIRANIYDVIDLIYKTNIEMYENILISENSFSYYERSSFVHMGRSYNIKIDFKNPKDADEVINNIRNRNAKIVTISTENYNVSYKEVLFFIKKIVENSSALIILDDSSNNKNITEFVELVNIYQNLIIVKSTYTLNKVHDNTQSFIISNEKIISNLKNFTNYLDINILTKAFCIFSLSYNDEEFKNIKKESKPKEEVLTKEEIKEEIKEIKEEVKEEPKKEIKENDKERIKVESVGKYVPNLKAEDRQSLITEVTKFEFISIFSSNANHVYIVTKAPLHSILANNGILLKRYNSSNGEILRLTIENTKQNYKILEIIDEIKNTRGLVKDYD